MYDTFYGLSAKPFQLNPDARFFYLSSSHKRAKSYLRYGLSQAEGFIVITGDIGTGKTTLVRNLFAELDTSRVRAAQLVTTQLDDTDMLRMVTAAFGLAYEGLDKATLLKQFERFLIEGAQQGKRTLLVVDEVQNLPMRSLEELRMLSNFEWQNRPLLQSFLLGQKEFRITLHSPLLEQLRQRVIASSDLRPLRAEETRAYILHRLTLAGWKQDPVIDDAALARLHDLSAGVPRRINLLCDRALLYGYLEELHRIDVEVVENVAQELAEEMASPDTAQAMASAQQAADAEQAEDINTRVARLERAIGAARNVFSKQTRLLERIWDYE